MTADLIIGSGAALAAIGMLLLGAYIHESVESAARWLRSLPAFRRHPGCHVPGSSLARDYPYLPLPAAQVTAHADAMFAASEEYLPPSPAGEHPCPPYVPAWRAIEPVRTGEHPPWTGSQIALDEAAEAEMDRVRYVRAQLAECGDRPTADDLRRVLDSLRRPVYGEAPQAEVREAGRLAGVMLP